ncbi:MAG: O-antigen ligase family protein [Deltaproteobacteria bacterium]|nr:O-antigen ligase family protein [Deltaproteobacteria bacterium]
MATWLWRHRNAPVSGSAYAVAVAVFAVLSIGHTFSSVYVWVSLQHALNIGTAAVLLGWAAMRFRGPSERSIEIWFPLWLAAVAAFEFIVALYQRIAGGTTRPEGTFSNPVFLSEFLAVAAICLTARAFWAREDEGLPRYAWGAGALLFLASALSLTGSRGVALAIVPALGVLIVLRFGVSRGWKMFFFLGLPVLAVVGWHSAARFFEADIYHYGRWVFWRAALRIFSEHPFGVGIGSYKYFWFQAQEPFPNAFRHYAKSAHTPHNEYLEVLVGLGFLGLISFLLVIVPPMIAAAREWKTVPQSRRGLAAGAYAALVLTGVHAFVNFNFHEAGIFCTGALLLGVLLGCLPARSLVRAVELSPWLAKGGSLICLLLSVASASLLAGTVAFERGASAIRRGDLDSAERNFKIASVLDPFRAPIPDALSGLSYRRYLKAVRPDRGSDASRHLEDSIRWQEKARELCPLEHGYSDRLAHLFRERYRWTNRPGDLEASLRHWDETLRINPYLVEALWEKASTLQGFGRTVESTEVLLRAVTVEPNFCRGYARLAELTKGADEPRSVAWEARAAECRESARGRSLEGNERWLLEEPRSMHGTQNSR